MSESHRSAFGVKTVGGGKHMAVSSAPSNEHSVGLGIPLELELGDVVGDACDFFAAHVDHAFVVRVAG